MNDSIPVIGTAVVNTPYWVNRLIMSVDYPVDNFVIFNNNGRGEIDDELNLISKINHKYIKNIKVCHLPGNIGCPGAWNLIIKTYLMSPYWIIVNHDVAFTQGFLSSMIDKSKDPKVGMVHGKSGEFGIGTMDLFLIKDWVIQRHGLFDENFYPAYVEDVDYFMRLFSDPITRIVDVGVPYFHGETFDYSISGAQTIKEDKSLEEKLNKARIINEYEYMDSKWGKDWRYCSPYKHPYNNPSFKLGHSDYDLNFVRKKHLGF